MPNPKRKHSKARRDKRRSANSKLYGQTLSTCANCGKAKLPHRICPHCGYYNGKPIVIAKVKEEKKK